MLYIFKEVSSSEMDQSINYLLFSTTMFERNILVSILTDLHRKSFWKKGEKNILVISGTAKYNKTLTRRYTYLSIFLIKRI